MFAIHEVATGLWVGPCPNSPERILHLRKTGISAVLSVQTDSDLTEMGMSWNLMWRFMLAQGLACQRHAITDFDDKALLAGLDTAVAAVDELRRGGHQVYLHCSAGVNRSPTVAIAYLVQHASMELDAAWQQVTGRRPSQPNRLVLERWVAAKRPA
ncbi:MAG: dual specificity protein phosphatase family protein [Deltaproteobacteria bacterium]|nr:dual specificity protein phosphatase family protein [Deltaproteobacteria bacterium]